jgi:cell division protein FtsB
MIKKKRGKTYLFSLVIVLVVILAVVKLVISNRLATFGQRLDQIKQEEIGLKEERYILEEKIYQLSSLESVRKRASELDFDRAREIVYYGREVPVALR